MAAGRGGAAQLGYGEGDETTVINGGPDNNRIVTTYFRRAFALSDPAAFSSLSFRLLRDDGAVVHLNGLNFLQQHANRDDQPGYRCFIGRR